MIRTLKGNREHSVEESGRQNITRAEKAMFIPLRDRTTLSMHKECSGIKSKQKQRESCTVDMGTGVRGRVNYWRSLKCMMSLELMYNRLECQPKFKGVSTSQE